MNTLLDTNILIRLVQPDHDQHIAARDAVRLLLERGEDLAVVPQNLYEFWVVATRPATANGLGMTIEQAQAELSQIKKVFRLFRDERGILSWWEQLVAGCTVRGKAAHDARLVAAMARHGMGQLLTFNSGDFDRFADVTVLTPEGVLLASTES